MSAIPLEDPIIVGNRLEELNLTKEQLLEVVDAAVGGRRSCTAFDPRSAPGWESWRSGNRRLREIFVPLGWKLDETDGIPSVINKELGIKVTMCNTDAGTGLKDHHPQQTSKKGSATQEIVTKNQMSFLDVLDLSMKVLPFSNLNPSNRLLTWYLCVFAEDEIVRAELSLPVRCQEGLFHDFNERIFLISEQDGGSGVKVERQKPDDGDSGMEIVVKRKQAL